MTNTVILYGVDVINERWRSYSEQGNDVIREALGTA